MSDQVAVLHSGSISWVLITKEKRTGLVTKLGHRSNDEFKSFTYENIAGIDSNLETTAVMLLLRSVGAEN